MKKLRDAALAVAITTMLVTLTVSLSVAKWARRDH